MAMPTFSNSRLSAYENCPMQYRLKYVDEVAVPPRESVEAYLGKRVHEALEFLYVRIGDGYKPPLHLPPGAQARALSRENIAPCGSTPCTIQLPPGTSIGPLITLPPAALRRSMAAPMPSTWK